MKKYIICFALFVAQFGMSQELNPLKNKEVGVVNIGIDFSKTTFIGAAGFTNPQDIYNRYLADWNRILVSESEKFDFQKSLKLTRYKFDVNPMRKHNLDLVKPENMVLEHIPTALTESDLAGMVKVYTEIDEEFPVAMVWIPEYYNKKTEIAFIHLVFFEVKSRKIIWTKGLEGKPSGFGVRNYWINQYKYLAKRIKMKQSKWSKE